MERDIDESFISLNKEKKVFLIRRDIIEKVITNVYPKNEEELLANPFHYTSVDTAEKIFSGDDIRLNHARYSNDRDELIDGERIINNVIDEEISVCSSYKEEIFLKILKRYLKRIISKLDVYIFCTSVFWGNNRNPDLLSQWRAYGANGTGVCLELSRRKINNLCYWIPGLRFNPVFYDDNMKIKAIKMALYERKTRSMDYNLVRSIAQSLIFFVPLFKNIGFREEMEWRLIYINPTIAANPKLYFHMRRDFLAPYISLKNLQCYVADKQRKELGNLFNPPMNIPEPTIKPLVELQSVMVGPSGDIELNLKAMKMSVDQLNRSMTVTKSSIPYRLT